MTSQPLQTECLHSTIVLSDARWVDDCGAVAGARRTVCLDRLASEARRGKCLVYSFSVGEDSGGGKFEDALSRLGCRVRKFDPASKSRTGTPRNSSCDSFRPWSLAHFNGISQVDRIRLRVRIRWMKARFLRFRPSSASAPPTWP